MLGVDRLLKRAAEYFEGMHRSNSEQFYKSAEAQHYKETLKKEVKEIMK